MQLIDITACFTGHRDIGNYNFKHPDSLRTKDVLQEIATELIEKRGVKRFISGGALGVDMIAFFAMHRLKEKYPFIKNIVAVPCKSQASKWTDEQKKWYDKMLSLADEVVYVDTITEYQIQKQKDGLIKEGDYHPTKMFMRNMYMVDNSRYVIAVYDGRSGGTQKTYDYAIDKRKVVYRINPKLGFTYYIFHGDPSRE